MNGSKTAPVDLSEADENKPMSANKKEKRPERFRNDTPHDRPIKSLPLLLIQDVIDEEAHQCRCPEYCEPNFDEALVVHVKDF